MEKTILDTLRKSIYAKEKSVLDFNKTIEELRKIISKREAEEMTLITTDIDTQTMKPRYSNADKRQAQLAINLTADHNYQDELKTLKDKEKQLALLTIELQDAKLEFRSYEIISRMNV